MQKISALPDPSLFPNTTHLLNDLRIGIAYAEQRMVDFLKRPGVTLAQTWQEDREIHTKVRYNMSIQWCGSEYLHLEKEGSGDVQVAQP